MVAALPQKHAITVNEWQKMVAANVFSPKSGLNSLSEYWLINLNDESLEIYRQPLDEN